MSDAKTLIAAALAALGDAATAVDAEQAALVAANQEIDWLHTQVASQANTIVALTAQLAALDPWAGIDKTGATDVTAAVQKILSAGPATMPAGRYLIDPTVSLTVRYALTMDPAAVLVAKANSAPRYYVMKLLGDDLTLKGGQIIGDRLSHTYTAGSTHEWGYGISVVGSDVTIDGLMVSECTGDGIGVSGVNCTIRNVVSTKNRRQGMSVFASGLKVYDSEFSLTGALGTDPAAPNGPCAGVDIEPDAGMTLTGSFDGCSFLNNRAGLLAWLRVEVGGSLNITATNCTMANNANGVQAKALAGSITMALNGCAITKNTGSGVKAEAGSTITANGNTFTGMATRAAFDLTGTDTRTKYDIPIGAGGQVSVGLNHYK